MDHDEISAWLGVRYGRDDLAVEQIGEGAWSCAYRFALDGVDLVVRVGGSRSDFEKDRAAAHFAGDDLPVPCVHAVGDLRPGTHFCISDFVPGTPLESVDTDVWYTVVPHLVDVMEAMRALRPATVGPPWRSILRRETGEVDDPRIAMWRRKLADDDRGSEAFIDGTRALQRIDVGDVPASLVHADVVNRNVHVHDGRVSGIFDWGCTMWGDHLYDLACIEFWSPWHPSLDVDALAEEFHRRWARDGVVVERFAERRRACLLHVGLEHIVYHAVMADPDARDAVIERMTTLDLI